METVISRPEIVSGGYVEIQEHIRSLPTVTTADSCTRDAGRYA